MIQCEALLRCHVDKHDKPFAEAWSGFNRHVAWHLVRDTLLALLHGKSRRDAVLSVLLRVHTLRLQQSHETDGRLRLDSGLHADDLEVAVPLV